MCVVCVCGVSVCGVFQVRASVSVCVFVLGGGGEERGLYLGRGFCLVSAQGFFAWCFSCVMNEKVFA